VGVGGSGSVGVGGIGSVGGIWSVGGSVSVGGRRGGGCEVLFHIYLPHSNHSVVCAVITLCSICTAGCSIAHKPSLSHTSRYALSM